MSFRISFCSSINNELTSHFFHLPKLAFLKFFSFYRILYLYFRSATVLVFWFLWPDSCSSSVMQKNMSSIRWWSRKGKQIITSSSPDQDIFGGSSHDGDLISNHQHALIDTVGLNFNQLQLVRHAREELQVFLGLIKKQEMIILK